MILPLLVFPRIPGVNTPTLRARAAVSTGIALSAMALLYRIHFLNPANKSDFGVAWFGARALLHHANPYVLVGPGHVYDWPWNLLYPATTMVAAIPLSWLSERSASLAFVGMSSWTLAWVVTRTGWERLPLFLSAAWVVASQSGQWSPLFTAMWCARSCDSGFGEAEHRSDSRLDRITQGVGVRDEPEVWFSSD